MSQLYPFKFKPIYKSKIWGGNRLAKSLNKKGCPENCGESWEISAIEGNISEVSNGFLEGNNLQELIEIYMGDLVGEKVFKKFGEEFPLLFKFIDANDVLSIQVHPDDKIAKERHKAYGKTEMWYVIDASKDSWLISGFKENCDKQKFMKHLEEGNLKDLMNHEEVKSGDVFFLPAGRIHAIGSGILLAEIQQTSDITYRVFDWNRVESNGKPRELHTNFAVDVIDYKKHDNYKTEYEQKKNETAHLADCQYFKTNLLHFDKSLLKDYSLIDSFVIHMCLEGEYMIRWEDDFITIVKGESVLIPAEIEILHMDTGKEAKILEVYI